MGNVSQDIHLAPVGVLRAAAWPMEALSQFGDRALAELALQDLSIPAIWEQYTKTYERVLAQEREALWQQTADSPRFMKALALSNALVAKRTHLLQSRRHLRNKAIRRLDHTLYRYLARAVGRTTPHSLWAGVTAVILGETTQIQVKPPQYLFTPDLRPFQTILKHLGRRSPYWECTVWQVNPTIAQQPDGSWQWWARSQAGQVERRSLTPTGADAFLQALTQLTSGTFAQLALTLSQRLGLLTTTGVDSALWQLATDGMLLGGLDLPTRFTTPWDALIQAEALLVDGDRKLWHQTIGTLEVRCKALAEQLETLTYEAVVESLATATQQVSDLAASLGIADLQLPEPILHCDYGLPFEVELGPIDTHHLQKTIAAYERDWLLGWSPATAFRLAQQRIQQQRYQEGLEIASIQLTPPAPVLNNWEAIAQVYPAIEPYLQAWEQILAQPAAAVTLPSPTASLPLPLAPWGCLYTQLHQGFGQTIHGISDYATQAFARFSSLIDPQGQFKQWCQAQLQAFAVDYDLAIADLQSPLESNPNVLAKPLLNAQPISLWSVDAQTLSLHNGVVKLDLSTQLPLLYLPGQKQAIAVFGFASAHIAGGDPIAATLLQTGFQANPSAIFQATALPTPAELRQPRFTPRVWLSHGDCLGDRRTVITKSQLQFLIHAAAMERFVLWQQLASDYGWPAMLRVEVAGEVALLVQRDSPLALSALFKGINGNSPFLIVEAADQMPWLVDGQGYHYQAELAQPFGRKVHGWTGRTIAPTP